MSKSVNRALRAWGANPPEWIAALASACDKSSQAAVARELRVSSTVVNQLLGRCYPGRIDGMEQRVRGVYLRAVVACPILGEISTRDCLENQKRKFRATNPTRVKLAQTCPTCLNREDACSKRNGK